MPEVRLIDANALMEKVCGNCQLNDCVPDATDTVYGCMFLESIDQMPTIEAEPVRHGRWIDVPYANTKVAKCSLCGFWQRTNGDDKTGKHLIHNSVYRYCAGCGARMGE